VLIDLPGLAEMSLLFFLPLPLKGTWLHLVDFVPRFQDIMIAGLDIPVNPAFYEYKDIPWVFLLLSSHNPTGRTLDCLPVVRHLSSQFQLI